MAYKFNIMEKTDLLVCISCIRTVIARKKSNLKNFDRKIHRAILENQTGIAKMRFGKLQRESYIIELEKTLERIIEKI